MLGFTGFLIKIGPLISFFFFSRIVTWWAAFICLQKMECFFLHVAFLSIRRHITITSWHQDKGHKSHVVEAERVWKFWTSRQGSRTQYSGQRFHRSDFSKWLHNSWPLELVVQAANELWKVLAVFLIFLISEVYMCWEKVMSFRRLVHRDFSSGFRILVLKPAPPAAARSW